MPAFIRNISPRAAIGDAAAADRLLSAAASGAVLLLPLALLYARAIGDVVLTAIGVLFLIRSAVSRDWTWLRTPWTRLALLLWGWMLLCTLVGGNRPAIVQALVALRFFILLPALETWVLADSRMRQRLWYVILAAGLWILVEVWQQYILGTNIFGYPRWLDGALTGPFRGPVAGQTLLWLFFPAFLPLSFLLLKRTGRLERLCGVALLVLAAATMILIGQRMPTLLMALGLCISGLLFRQVRLPVLLALAVSGVVLALLPIVSPPTFAKLVLRFTDQMQHFWDTQYGLIFGRAVTMVQAHPWLGLGWDGYRDFCMAPQYLTGVSWLPIGNPADALGCSIHPHNYWLQVATDAGLPGLALFAALIGVWLWRLGRGGAGCRGNDRQAALLVILFVMMWPIASATSLFTVPNAGWVFLMAGWGLAEAWAGSAYSATRVVAGDRGPEPVG
ncbi:MAG: O-antigen ligase family protein [Rhodopila sp.]